VYPTGTRSAHLTLIAAIRNKTTPDISDMIGGCMYNTEQTRKRTRIIDAHKDVFLPTLVYELRIDKLFVIQQLLKS
jgi:hypothetical protein